MRACDLDEHAACLVVMAEAEPDRRHAVVLELQADAISARCALARALLNREPMLLLLRPVLIVAGVFLAVTGTCFYLFTRAVDSRFTAAEGHVARDCKAYRSAARHRDAAVCADDPYAPSAVKDFEQAKKEIEAASLAYARFDEAGGNVRIAHALDLADVLDRRARSIDLVVASSIVKAALDVVERSHLPPATRLSLFAHVQLASAAAPFEAERVHTEWGMLRYANELPGGPFARLAVADAVRDDDIATAEMNRAALDGDLARCESAASAPRGVLGRSGIAPVLCPKMIDLVKTGRRLDRDVTDAIRDSGQPTLRR
jgi:hypothetical protein